jgi:hypothetical protein
VIVAVLFTPIWLKPLPDLTKSRAHGNPNANDARIGRAA